MVGQQRTLHPKTETYQAAAYQRQAAQRLVAQLEEYLDLVATLEETAASLKQPIQLEGYHPPSDHRLERLQDCAVKRRQIAKDVMVELDLKKITAPDFTVSIRPGTPSLLVLDPAAVPGIYWQPVEPRLDRQGLLGDLKQGAQVDGVALSNPEPVLSVRTR
jgi:hypothetical protein